MTAVSSLAARAHDVALPATIAAMAAAACNTNAWIHANSDCRLDVACRGGHRCNRCRSATSCARAANDETAVINAIDQAVRTGEFGRARSPSEALQSPETARHNNRLGLVHRIGRGAPQDDLLAFKWMKAAADKNHANAQFNLAKMYLAGRGAALDVGAAKSGLQKAASQGYDEAAKLLV